MVFVLNPIPAKETKVVNTLLIRFTLHWFVKLILPQSVLFKALSSLYFIFDMQCYFLSKL